MLPFPRYDTAVNNLSLLVQTAECSSTRRQFRNGELRHLRSIFAREAPENLFLVHDMYVEVFNQ